jgi:hypothetical protein
MPFALDGNPTQSEISEAINYLLANFGGSVTADPNTGQILGPTGNVIGYLYKYVVVRYADNSTGSSNFSSSPTGRLYYGLRNNDSSTPSTNPTDYIWYKVTGGFGTTNFLFYQTVGGRQIEFRVTTAAPDPGWISSPTTAIDLDVVTSSAVASSSFFTYFSPSALQVPRTGSPLTPSFTGLAPKMYGSNNGTAVTFVASQTDSDVAFVANTWRIGNSSTTGYTDISKLNITIANPSDGGGYALWPAPTAMASSPAYLTVPVRYKNSLGVVTQSNPSLQQFTFVDQGPDGNQNAIAYLYQWATSTPTNPSGSSTFTWATGANSGYTGGGGWAVTVPANPGTPLIQLWVASKAVVATGGTTTSTVSWTSGYNVAASSQNGATGASGTQNARPTVYQWALTIPTISGTSTYTWSSGAYTAPSGWSTTITSSPTAGYTLWAATVSITDTATATTTSINWTTASIVAAGYAGGDGLSSRLCYARVASNPTPVSGSITTSGSSSFPSSAQSNTTWGFTATWSGSDPSPSSTNSLYQSDGIYNPSTGNTTWNTPYISSLKVGQLSAITANCGTLTSGTITAGMIQSGTTGTYNTYASFGLGVSTSANGWPAAATFASTNIGYAGLVAINTGAGPAIAAATTSTVDTRSAILGFGASNSSASTYRNFGALGSGDGAGIFQTAGTGNLASVSPTADIRLGYYTGSTSYAYYVYSGSAFPFTAGHDALQLLTETIPEVGDLMVDVELIASPTINDAITQMTKSTTANQKGVIGVFTGVTGTDFVPSALGEYVQVDGMQTVQLKLEYTNIYDTYRCIGVNAIGEGKINVCGQGGNIEIGDLICASDMAGKGMKQGDDLYHAYTVAKARQTVTFTSPDQVVQIACIYVSG